MTYKEAFEKLVSRIQAMQRDSRRRNSTLEELIELITVWKQQIANDAPQATYQEALDALNHKTQTEEQKHDSGAHQTTRLPPPREGSK